MDRILGKNVKRSSQTGFTLVELLVVVGIIGLLVGLISVAVPKAIESGMKAKTKGELTSIVAAVKAYKQEYGRWPGSTTADTDKPFENASSESLISALGGPSNTLVENPKAVRFLEGASTDGKMKDPWGTQYFVILDSDESNSILYQGKTISMSVLAVSFGKDTTKDTNPGSGDDVFSTDLK
jgi:prepilin-type N-terminal cleavage/methylation domain-containing protein